MEPSEVRAGSRFERQETLARVPPWRTGILTAAPGGLVLLSGLRRAAMAMARLAPGARARLSWRELGHKLSAYEAFRRGAAGAVADGRAIPVAEAVAAACARAPEQAVWAVEGLGHAHAASRAGVEPRRWLAAALAEAPAAAWTPLACGIGVLLAERRLGELAAAGGPADPADLERQLAADLAGWRRLLPEGFPVLLVETQGFVARLRHPRLLPVLAGRWRRIGEAASAGFWHGAGRGAYFALRHALPGSSLARRERSARPHPAALADFRAGLAFATTLVNLAEPRILDRRLRDLAGPPAAAPALAHGIGSALRVGQPFDAGGRVLERWRRHQLEQPEGEVSRLWRRGATEPLARWLTTGGEVPAAGPPGLFAFPSPPAAAGTGHGTLPRFVRTIDRETEVG